MGRREELMNDELKKILNDMPSILKLNFTMAEQKEDGTYIDTYQKIHNLLITIPSKDVSKKFIKFLQCKSVQTFINEDESLSTCEVFKNETKCNAEAIKYLIKKFKENIKDVESSYCKIRIFECIKALELHLEFMELTDEKYIVMKSEVKLIDGSISKDEIEEILTDEGFGKKLMSMLALKSIR